MVNLDVDNFVMVTNADVVNIRKNQTANNKRFEIENENCENEQTSKQFVENDRNSKNVTMHKRNTRTYTNRSKGKLNSDSEQPKKGKQINNRSATNQSTNTGKWTKGFPHGKYSHWHLISKNSLERVQIWILDQE